MTLLATSSRHPLPIYGGRGNSLLGDMAMSSRAVIASGGAEPFDPASLFAAAEQGAVYDFTDETTLYQDTGRTTPVTAPGQLVYSATDLSGNNNHIPRSAGSPRWMGHPATWGANLVTSPLMEDAGDWTAGTGWSISGGVATKTAGTASALSQAISLTAGKTYMAQLRVATRTAGTVKARLTGGTTVTINTGYNAAGEYLDLLTAVTGNTTLEVYADATFAGTVNVVGLYEVTSFYDMGVAADFAERLLTGNIDMSATDELTVIVAAKRGRRTGNMYFSQVAASATGQSELFKNVPIYGASANDGVGASDDVTENDPDLAVGLGYFIYGTRRKFSEVAIADQHRLQLNGIELAQSNSSGPFNTSTMNSATTKISLLSWINNSSFFAGTIYRVIVINRVLTDAEMEDAVNWCGFDGKFAVAGCTGDSTWDKDSSAVAVDRGNTSFTIDMIGPVARMLALEHWGDDTLEQNADWSALTGTSLSKLDEVQISVGLNDIAGRVDSGATVPEILSDLQSYIDEIAADCPNARLIGWKLHPVKGWLDGRTNAADCIAAREAWNTALTDGTITGLDAVCDQHVDQMDDGSGYLKSILNTGPNGVPDGVHPGELGRLIMGVSAREARVALGTMTGARSFA